MTHDFSKFTRPAPASASRRKDAVKIVGAPTDLLVKINLYEDKKKTQSSCDLLGITDNENFIWEGTSKEGYKYHCISMKLEVVEGEFTGGLLWEKLFLSSDKLPQDQNEAMLKNRLGEILKSGFPDATAITIKDYSDLDGMVVLVKTYEDQYFSTAKSEMQTNTKVEHYLIEDDYVTNKPRFSFLKERLAFHSNSTPSMGGNVAQPASDDIPF